MSRLDFEPGGRAEVSWGRAPGGVLHQRDAAGPGAGLSSGKLGCAGRELPDLLPAVRSAPAALPAVPAGLQSLRRGETLHREVGMLLPLWHVWCGQNLFIRALSALSLTNVKRLSFVSRRGEVVGNEAEAWLLGQCG